MPLARTVAVMIWLGLSAIWIVVTAIFVVWTWESSTQELHDLYEKRERQCVSRYSAPDARERCLVIMELERYQSRSIAMFNRGLLVLGPPLLGLGIVVYSRRRKQTVQKRKR